MQKLFPAGGFDAFVEQALSRVSNFFEPQFVFRAEFALESLSCQTLCERGAESRG